MDQAIVDSARSILQATFLDTQLGLVVNPTYTADGLGGSKETYNHGSGVSYPVNVQPYTTAGMETVEAAEITESDLWTLLFPFDAVIDAKAKIFVGTDEYDVLGSSQNATQQFLKTVIGKKIPAVVSTPVP